MYIHKYFSIYLYTIGSAFSISHIYIYTYWDMYTFLHIFLHHRLGLLYLHIFIHILVHVHIRVHAYIFSIYIYLYIYWYMYIFLRICVHHRWGVCNGDKRKSSTLSLSLSLSLSLFLSLYIYMRTPQVRSLDLGLLLRSARDMVRKERLKTLSGEYRALSGSFAKETYHFMDATLYRDFVLEIA